MTNAEKYLKDNVSVEELVKKIADYKPRLETSDNVYAKMQEFFYEQAKPTLTEDERVILRNIKNVGFNDIIGRWEDGKLYLKGTAEMKAFAINTMYGHLFQFIKERRRI